MLALQASLAGAIPDRSTILLEVRLRSQVGEGPKLQPSYRRFESYRSLHFRVG